MYLNIYESIFDTNQALTRRPADNRSTALGRVLSALTQTAYHEAVLWRPLEQALARAWFQGAGRLVDDRGVLVIVYTWWRPADWGARLVRFRSVMTPTWGKSWMDAEARRVMESLQATGRMGWTDNGQECVVRPPDLLGEMPDSGWFSSESDAFVSADGAGDTPGVIQRVRSFVASVESLQPSPP